MHNAMNFPDEFASPSEKEKDPYGLAYAQAMYNNNNRFGSRLFYDDEEYDSLVEFSQGRQSVDNMKKLFGYYRNQNSPFSDGPESLAYLDIQNLNLAPKYINRAVAKMQALNYNISLAAIDIATMDDIKNYESAVQAFYRIKDWMKEVNINPQEFFPDIDIASLPEYPENYAFDAKVNPKVKKIISAEKTIKLIHQINNTKQKLREVCWDICVVGRGHFECFPDQNEIPRLKRINPKYWVGNYVDNENYEDQSQQEGYIDFITVNQFRKEAHGRLEEKTIQEVADHFSNVNAPYNAGTVMRQPQNYDGLGYIPVFRFYFLSTDYRTYRVQMNDFGNPTIKEVSFGYRYPDGAKIKPGSKIIDNEYDSVYGGSWVVDSDVIYNYGRKPYPRTQLVNQTLPIKTFAPNMKEGRVISFAAQMVEPVFMANVAWNKIKEILAKGWMGVQEIDFNQLEKVALGRGNNQWSPRDVMEFFLMTNRMVKRGRINQYDQSDGKAVTTDQSGLLLTDYFAMFTNAIQILENQVGSSVVEQFNTPDRLAVGVMEASVASTNIDMEWLFNGHDQIYEKASHQLLLLAQQAKRNKKYIGGVLPALGKSTLEVFEVPDDLAYTEFGLYMKRLQNEQQQWAELYLDIRESVKMDKLGPSDKAFLYNIDNLKEAREYLAIREEQAERREMKKEAINQQAALEANAQAAQMKTDGNLQEIQMQGQIDKMLKVVEGQIKERLVSIENQYRAQSDRMTEQMKMMTKKQEGMDNLLKQAMKNSVDRMKIDKRPDRSPSD